LYAREEDPWKHILPGSAPDQSDPLKGENFNNVGISRFAYSRDFISKAKENNYLTATVTISWRSDVIWDQLSWKDSCSLASLRPNLNCAPSQSLIAIKDVEDTKNIDMYDLAE
jgi:hypothetical protein